MTDSAPVQLTAADLFVRELGPPRMDFTIGKGASLFPEWMRINVEVRMELTGQDGRKSTGCSADWPSFGWLDKRNGVAPRRKLAELLELVQATRDLFLEETEVLSPFENWWGARSRLLDSDAGRNAVPLCATFCLSLFERALIDGWCKLHDLPFFDAVRENGLGIDLARIHPELSGMDPGSVLPEKPSDSLLVRHTVGQHDPLSHDQIPDGGRLKDGLPQTLDKYIRRDGIRHLKVKISGELDADLARLREIANVLQDQGTLENSVLTLDGNESFMRLPEFQRLVEMLATQQAQLFRHIRFIEQPLNRANTFEDETAPAIRQIDRMVPLIIDEADDTLDAFPRARELGYRGVSHKNCKGIFKSIANLALCRKWNEETPERYFLSAEDLTNLPPVALHQDLVVVAALGLDDAERNGHHFFRGLSHLDETTRKQLLEQFPKLYRELDDTGTLDIRDGRIDMTDLIHRPGLAALEPDWDSLKPLSEWIATFDAEQVPTG